MISTCPLTNSKNIELHAVGVVEHCKWSVKHQAISIASNYLNGELTEHEPAFREGYSDKIVRLTKCYDTKWRNVFLWALYCRFDILKGKQEQFIQWVDAAEHTLWVPFLDPKHEESGNTKFNLE